MFRQTRNAALAALAMAAVLTAASPLHAQDVVPARCQADHAHYSSAATNGLASPAQMARAARLAELGVQLCAEGNTRSGRAKIADAARLLNPQAGQPEPK